MPDCNSLLDFATGVVFLVQLGQENDSLLIERFELIPARVVDLGKPIEIVHRVPVQTPFGIRVGEVRREAAPAVLRAGHVTRPPVETRRTRADHVTTYRAYPRRPF